MVISEFKKMPFIVHLAFFGVFLTRTVYFMLWPFISIIFYQKFHVPIVDIGMILTLVALLSIALSFYTGHLSDIFGRKWILIIGLFCTLCSFIPLLFAQKFLYYILLLIGVALGKGLIQTLLRAQISDSLSDLKLRETAFYLFYFFVNVGAVVGPVLSIYFTLSMPVATFFSLSIFYFSYIILCAIYVVNKSDSLNKKSEKHTILYSVNIIKNDRAFIFFMIANFFITLVYSQIDTTLAQYFAGYNSKTLIHLFGLLVISNALIVIVFQFPFLKIISKYRLSHQIYVGIILLAMAQIIFIFAPVYSSMGWILGIVVISFSEIILFSVLNVQMDRLAPEHLKGVYFGASNLCNLGFVMAPYVGSILLVSLGRETLFVLMGLLCGVIYISYKRCVSHSSMNKELQVDIAR